MLPAILAGDQSRAGWQDSGLKEKMEFFQWVSEKDVDGGALAP
jgi:hypothetical protein